MKLILCSISLMTLIACSQQSGLSLSGLAPNSNGIGSHEGNNEGDDSADNTISPDKEVNPSPIDSLKIPGHNEAPEGVLGGHFDLDTSHLVYPFSKGTTDFHVHMYDDKFMTAIADFFNLLEPGLHNIQNQITDPSKRFSILVTNAELSDKVILDINGQSQNALSVQKALRATGLSTAPVYTIGAPQVAGDIQLKSLSLKFPLDILQTGGLIPTATGCVRSNRPGAKGEYRNGALTIQAIEVGGVLDAATHSAALNNGKLLWEATVFWHRDGVCYGDANYIP